MKNLHKLVRLTFVVVLVAAMTQVLPSRMVAQSAIGTVVTVSGFVLNANNLNPVDAAYSVYDARGGKVGQSHRANEKDGFLITGLKPGATYTVRVEDPRFFKQEFSIVLPNSSKYTEISKDFVVRPLEVGRKIMITPTPFDLKKSDLKEGTEDDMSELARTLMLNPNVNVELVCYPDEELAATQAAAISVARGNAIKAYLETNGVNSSRITVKATNSTDPVNPPPIKKGAKGKRYVGSAYLVVTKV
ncbi:MAG: OmpA family protein [Bradyrhizobiaceae bacterium]|nr:OmpA family protein [Bradyrhizobiaceae bacterium]